MSHRIARIETDPAGQALTLHWKEVAVTTKNFRHAIARRPLFAAPADPKTFARARVLDGGYAVGWPRTEIELAADALWYEAHPRALPWPDAVMTAADFKHWMQTETLSLSAAAGTLGLSRRTIAYYASGARAIPRVVFLACMALAGARRRTRDAA